MIVKCDQCQTRFRIPDEKVTPKGVKVRCTKCQHTFRVKREADAPVPPVAPLTALPPLAVPPPPPPLGTGDADPFARFGAAPSVDATEATRPGVFHEGLLATRPPAVPRANDPPADGPRNVFDSPTRVAAPPPPPPGRRPLQDSVPAVAPLSAAAPASWELPPQGDAGFGQPWAGLGAPAVPPVAAAPVTAPSPPLEDPFDFGPASMPSAPPSGGMEVDFGGSADPSSTLPEDDGAPAAGPESNPFGDISFEGMSDGSAEPPASPPEPGPEPELASPPPPADRAALFDLPEPPPPQDEPKPLLDLPEHPTLPAVPLAKLELRKSSPGLPALGASPTPPPAQRASVLVVNLVLALLLVGACGVLAAVLATEGSADNVPLVERLKAAFTPAHELVAVDVSNGLYETRVGRPVFFVRGDIENKSGKPARAKVRAEIYDGTQLVRAAEGFAGKTPSPEELYDITNVTDLDALTRRLEGEAATLAPGGRARFVVTFYEYPPDLRGFRLRVTVQPVGQGSTAAR